MSTFDYLNKLVFGERFSDIHENVSENNLLVDSYIYNTKNIISKNNYFVLSSITQATNLTDNLNEELIEDSIVKQTDL